MKISLTVLILSAILFLTCDDKVKKFSGFTQKEMEFLLASEDAKVWERISTEENGEEIILDDCGIDNYLIFLQGSTGQPKPLLYAYNPLICDSLEFCLKHPDFCQSDTISCNNDPDFCESLEEGILFIGTWYAKAPFITNERSDTLVFEINEKKESIFVTNISANYATFQYKNRVDSNGGVIMESYRYVQPEEE